VKPILPIFHKCKVKTKIAEKNILGTIFEHFLKMVCFGIFSNYGDYSWAARIFNEKRTKIHIQLRAKVFEQTELRP
jgi:hypothetical protein